MTKSMSNKPIHPLRQLERCVHLLEIALDADQFHPSDVARIERINILARRLQEHQQTPGVVLPSKRDIARSQWLDPSGSPTHDCILCIRSMTATSGSKLLEFIRPLWSSPANFDTDWGENLALLTVGSVADEAMLNAIPPQWHARHWRGSFHSGEHFYRIDPDRPAEVSLDTW